jgi:hypothetical protein
MAYIYMAGGWVIRVPTTRESVHETLSRAAPDETLTYEVDFDAGGATQPGPVTINAAQISLVTDQPLPASI